MKITNIKLIRLSILIIIMVIGILSLFYLNNLFSAKQLPTLVYTPKLKVALEYNSDDTDDSWAYVENVLNVSFVPYVRKTSDDEIETICKLVYGEGRGLNKTEMSAIIWCVLNRVDSDKFANDIITVCTQPNQFTGYRPNNPIWDNIKELVIDVIERWEKEKLGYEDIGRTLPSTYYYFIGDGKHNYYSEVWKSKNYYDWSLKSPY